MANVINQVCKSLVDTLIELDEEMQEDGDDPSKSLKKYIKSNRDDIWQLIRICESDFMMDTEDVLDMVITSLENL